MTSLGFIGVGRMGAPMVRRLLAAGHEVTVCDPNAAAVGGLVQAGAKAAGSPAHLAGMAEIVFLSLPTPEIVQAAALGTDGLAEGGALRIVVDLSTTRPRGARALAAGLAGRGIGCVDCPVSGGVAGAEGGRLSLMAAGQSDRVDAVVGTAPAAFGNFADSYDSFRDNAAQLWPILRGIHNARVMLFFFHGDDFDPGGRGESARGILSSRGLEHIVVDQPALLTGHGAATTGMFVRRFGSCILRFAEAPPRRGDPSCDESWGRTPSAELMRAAAPEPRTGSGTSSPAGTGARSFLGVWYGAYINGREIALAVDRVEGDAVYADYVLGPGMEADQPMERAQRKGRIENDELVFDEKGRNVLRYSIRTDGRLSATWLDRSGKGRLETTLRRMD